MLVIPQDYTITAFTIFQEIGIAFMLVSIETNKSNIKSHKYFSKKVL